MFPFSRLSRTIQSRRPRTGRPRQSALKVELLEDRLVPAGVMSLFGDQALPVHQPSGLAALTATVQADLSVLQTHTPPSAAAPGQAVSFQIQVTNLGPDSVSRFTLVDQVPTALHNPSFIPSFGFYNPNTGLWTLPSPLTANQAVTLTLIGTVGTKASGILGNTVQVTTPTGVKDPVRSNDSSTDKLKISKDLADLSVIVTDSTATGMTTAGSQVTYTIVVTNNGPLSVTGAKIEQTFPAELNNVSWTTKASTGSSVTPSSGNDNISSLANLLPGGTVTFTVTATLSGSLQIGDSVVNVATVSPPDNRADPVLTNNLS